MPFRSRYPDVVIPDVPITDYVLEHTTALGDKPAFIDGPSGRTITYGQFATLVKKLAGGLSEHGFKAGECAAIHSPNIPEYALTFHAIASLGGVVTPVNPLYTPREIADQLNDSQARYVFTIPQLLGAVQAAIPNTAVEHIFVYGEAEGAAPFASLLATDATPPDVQISADQLLVLPYSSGTTGLPKGVMLTHGNLVAECSVLEGFPDATLMASEDTVLAVLPFFHIYGIVAFLSYALRQGVTVVTMPRFDLEQYLQTVERYKVTFLHIVPPIVLGLAKHPIVDRFDLSNVRAALSAAAPLGDSVAEAFMQRLGVVISQAYGMTEVTGASHLGPATRELVKPASAGRLLPNTECKIIDPLTGDEVGEGEQGEIWVRGPIVMQGYLNQERATASTIDKEGWLRTGDIGYVDADGDFFVVDRVKELIKYKGYQVAPAELESVLLEHPSIVDAAVISHPDEEAGEVPKAYVVVKGDLTAEDVMAFVAERVSPHKKVRLVEFIDMIPKSASGKILRRMLIEQDRAG